MEVITAKTAGFCFGVKRAVEKVYDQVNQGKKEIYTYGPIIHNEEVVADLESKGVKVLESKEDLKNLAHGTVIIRSHGVGKEIYRDIEEQGLELVDATCPYVRKIHRIVREKSEQGKQIIIIGNDTHPEVEGIKGWCVHPAIVVGDQKAAEELCLPQDQEICIVSQTTFNYNKFKNLVEIIDKKGYDIDVINTICSATEERQLEAGELADKVDAMIVIGGKSSSNTQKLFEICKTNCVNTYYIQTLDDLELYSLPPVKCVGITAGASTPNYLIKEVQEYVRNEL